MIGRRGLPLLLLLLAAAGGAPAGEFVSAERGYAVDIPDDWFTVDAATVDRAEAEPEAFAGIGFTLDHLGECREIAADPGADYFFIGFGRYYSDNLNITVMEGLNLPLVTDPDAAKRELEEAMGDALQTTVKLLDAANFRAGGLPGLRLAFDLPEMKLGLMQCMIEVAPERILNFTLTANSDSFPAARDAVEDVVAGFRLVEK